VTCHVEVIWFIVRLDANIVGGGGRNAVKRGRIALILYTRYFGLPRIEKQFR